MALSIEKTIDLTASSKNPGPKTVSQLTIIHEAKSGELVQYYIDPVNKTEGDKNTYAVGVYNSETQKWTYVDYDEAVWNNPKQRIAGNRIDRLGVKAFPDVGAIAFYKLAYRGISRIVAPVNKEGERLSPPKLSAIINTDGSVTFWITPPKKPIYDCYRIVMRSEAYSTDHMTYDLTFTVSNPKVTGEYECYAVGYMEEGQICSKDSNVCSLSITGSSEKYVPSFVSRAEIEKIAESSGGSSGGGSQGSGTIINITGDICMVSASGYTVPSEDSAYVDKSSGSYKFKDNWIFESSMADIDEGRLAVIEINTTKIVPSDIEVGWIDE